jgi:2-keto-4-pentenoate hydratase/2-oxohepta-3-ene-1,7-dioic acid hydratase in catechol pathway
MKLVTFEVQTVLGKFRRLGIIHPEQSLVIDLNAAYVWLLAAQGRPQPQRWADFLFSGSMRHFLEMGTPALEAAREVEARFALMTADEVLALRGENGAHLAFRLDEVKLKTPVPDPRMLRDFISFETHIANASKLRGESVPEAWYKAPVYYKGNPYNIIGPDETVQWPSYSRIMDYELELACIIGKEGKNIPEEKAHEYIAGYAIMNDLSARDAQKNEMLCRLGPAKGKDFCTVVGPWLVTADEVDPRNLRMTAKVNGALWSDGNSGTSHWTFEQMIAHASKEETLYPGDIFGSGTVGFGCGLELNRWLQSGDTVELEIEGLGVLRTTVVSDHPVKK